jgi:hypothetical protein
LQIRRISEMTPEEIEAARLAEEEAARVAAELAAKAEPELDADGNPIVKPVEPWMEEEGEQDPDDPSKTVPVGKFVGLKKKLRGRISEQNEELEKLRRENAELAKLKPKEETVLERPKKDDFDTDDEFYEALDKYNLNRTSETINRTRLEDQRKAEQRQAQEKLMEAVDEHYLRAADLIEKSGIKPEIYQAADTTVRKAVEAITPNLGDVIVDQVISILGEGSEKVMYFLGRNKAALAKFQSLLASDKSGMKAAVYLGQEKQRLTNPIKPRSNAPNPPTNIKGDANVTGLEARFKKKYDAAHSKKNLQEAYNAKKEARKAGVDVSKW